VQDLLENQWTTNVSFSFLTIYVRFVSFVFRGGTNDVNLCPSHGGTISHKYLKGT